MTKPQEDLTEIDCLRGLKNLNVLNKEGLKLLDSLEKTQTYLVVWHYMANYGTDQVKATSPREAIEKHAFYEREDIELIAFPLNTALIKAKRKVQK